MVFEEAGGQMGAPGTRRLAARLKASKGPPWASSLFSSPHPKVTRGLPGPHSRLALCPHPLPPPPDCAQVYFEGTST